MRPFWLEQALALEDGEPCAALSGDIQAPRLHCGRWLHRAMDGHYAQRAKP